MKSPIKLNRTATITGALLALALFAALAMPVQAAYVADRATSTARAAVLRLCQRFCGDHCHHHGHEWCGGDEHYWCPGHH